MIATPLRIAAALLLGTSTRDGCSSAAESAIGGSAPETDVENESDGGRIVIEDEDGSLTVETGRELPQAIRDAFAVPSDQLVDFTSAMTDGRMTFVSVCGHVERDDLRSLTNELTAAVTSALWTIVTSFGSGEDKQLIVASRDD